MLFDAERSLQERRQDVDLFGVEVMIESPLRRIAAEVFEQGVDHELKVAGRPAIDGGPRPAATVGTDFALPEERLAGGGVNRGFAYGNTDDYGYYATENRVHMHDLHATILHLLGVDHERLTYRYAGRDFRLTDVYGRVVKDLLA